MNQSWIRYLPAFIRQRLEGRHDLQKAIGNTGWLFAENILRMGIGFFIGVWVARYLGPERYGLLSYALAFVSLFSPLATLGLDDIVVRNIVRDPAHTDETLGTAFILRLVGGVASFAAATVAVLLLRPTDDLSHWLVGIIAAGGVFHAFKLIECWFHSQVRAKYVVFARVPAFIACSVMKIALIAAGAPLTAFAIVGVLEVAGGALGLVVVYRSQGGLFKAWQGARKVARELMRDSWPLFFSIISIIVYQRIDQVMLQQMVGSREVGIYSVAVSMADVWSFIPSALYWSVYPSILEAKSVSDALFNERLQKFYNLMALSAYAIAIPVTLVGPWLIRILFGGAYAGAGPMLVVLIWANVFTSLEIARTAFLNAMNWNRVYFLMILAGGVLNIVLNCFLIPRYGGLGAAFASLVAYWFAAHGSCFLFRNLFRTGLMLGRAIVYPRVW
jgi:O-antigen/teichoic acid export membrane protein